jgi:hypothetical protein
MMANLSQVDRDFEDASRQFARECARNGVGLLARAFNHCGADCHPHIYSADVQERFRDLCIEIVALVETGEVQLNPRHATYQRAQAAKQDPALQAVLKRASRKTRIRSGRN